jgi:hypothetical protein
VDVSTTEILVYICKQRLYVFLSHYKPILRQFGYCYTNKTKILMNTTIMDLTFQNCFIPCSAMKCTSHIFITISHVISHRFQGLQNSRISVHSFHLTGPNLLLTIVNSSNEVEVVLRTTQDIRG